MMWRERVSWVFSFSPFYLFSLFHVIPILLRLLYLTSSATVVLIVLASLFALQRGGKHTYDKGKCGGWMVVLFGTQRRHRASRMYVYICIVTIS
ncbi:hypothetical protein F5X99DRAFT_168501 [Biscogniauxia marginata]|nr:hypothetical protein F5X99DRAFT_168501 [Biscogniauxia marginata]